MKRSKWKITCNKWQRDTCCLPKMSHVAFVTHNGNQWNWHAALCMCVLIKFNYECNECMDVSNLLEESNASIDYEHRGNFAYRSLNTWPKRDPSHEKQSQNVWYSVWWAKMSLKFRIKLCHCPQSFRVCICCRSLCRSLLWNGEW